MDQNQSASQDQVNEAYLYAGELLGKGHSAVEIEEKLVERGWTRTAAATITANVIEVLRPRQESRSQPPNTEITAAPPANLSREGIAAKEALLEPRKWTGGALIDLQKTTYPGAQLLVSREMLTVQVGPLVYKFTPSQVRAIEVLRVMPLLGNGIRIHHDIAGYPQMIAFWLWGNPATMAAELRQYGYGADPSAKFEPTYFPGSGFATAFFVVWIVILALVASVFGICILGAIWALIAGLTLRR